MSAAGGALGSASGPGPGLEVHPGSVRGRCEGAETVFFLPFCVMVIAHDLEIGSWACLPEVLSLSNGLKNISYLTGSLRIYSLV